MCFKCGDWDIHCVLLYTLGMEKFQLEKKKFNNTPQPRPSRQTIEIYTNNASYRSVSIVYNVLERRNQLTSGFRMGHERPLTKVCRVYHLI